MHKKVIQYQQNLTADTNISINEDDIEENFTGKIESLISFHTSILPTLLSPAAFLLLLFTAISITMGFYFQSYVRAVLFFVCSLGISGFGGILIGLKGCVTKASGDIRSIILYTLDITTSLLEKKRNEEDESALLPGDIFAYLICFFILPGVEKIMDTYLGLTKFVLYRIAESFLFSLTKSIRKALNKKKPGKSNKEQSVEDKLKKLEELKNNIEKVILTTRKAMNLIPNILLVLVFITFFPTMLLIVMTLAY